MIVSKKNPQGIDIALDELQSRLYDELTKSCKWTRYESYARAYKNYLNNDLIPEVYTKDGKYQEVFFNNAFNATSFFLVSDETEQINRRMFKQDMSIIYQLDIGSLYGNIPHRADEEAKQDITNAMQNVEKYVSHDITGIVTGFDKVYRDLKVSGNLQESLKLDDMSHSFLIRVDFSIKYSYTNCKFELR